MRDTPWPWVGTDLDLEEDAFTADPIVGWRYPPPQVTWVPVEGQARHGHLRFSDDLPQHPEGESVPAMDCSCGYYAYKEAEMARVGWFGGALYNAKTQRFEAIKTLYKVYLWGIVIEHGWGYRSEYIQVVDEVPA